MAFSLGTLLKTVKNYEIDRTKTNEEYVNHFLGCLLCASNFEDQFWPASYGKTQVSNILNCRRNAPKELKGGLKDPKSEECLLISISIYVEENLRQGCFNKLSSDVIGLCNRGNKTQSAIFDKLKVAMTNNTAKNENLDDENFKLSNFLAVALIEAVQIPNIIKADQVIKQRGNSVLYMHCGDIFKFAFNKKSKNKRIVVIPVNTRFDTHVSRKFEGDVKQIVSCKTLHGMWVERMIRRSKTKQKVDNEWAEQSEDVLRKRISADLEARGFAPDKSGEFTLGTISVIEEEDVIFYLIAASKFDENNNAYASKDEIKDVMKSLVEFYDKNGQGQDMYLPLIGTGMSRAGLSNQESFDEICEAFSPENSSFVGEVTIVVLPDVYDCLDWSDNCA